MRGPPPLHFVLVDSSLFDALHAGTLGNVSCLTEQGSFRSSLTCDFAEQEGSAVLLAASRDDR